MKNKLLFLLFTLASFSLFAQSDKRISSQAQKLAIVEQVQMPTLDNAALLAAELDRRGPGIAPRFAEVMEVDITPATHGTWESLPNGNDLWRLRIKSEDAKSLNLGFTKFLMPEGGTLILYSPDYKKVMGPFTPADNEVHEQLWTPILDGDELVIEVQIPSQVKSNLDLELGFINHDFIGFSSVVSGSCNLDVVCGAADGWEIVDGYRDIIRSVAVIGTGGGTFCTGFLINNANNDCTPYFMTANHCGINSGNAASLVTYWNFENSTCREPNSAASGGNGDGSLADFNTGSIFRAGWAASDFTLVELDDPVSETANAYFAGFSIEYQMSGDTTIGIHHPSTDEKRISFEFGQCVPGNGLNGTTVDISNGTHVIVPDWDIGTTEGGSSGSPLFNKNKQVVGQLHGGGAACGNDAYDTYGWMYASWTGGGTDATRLSNWLDPNGVGMEAMPGKDCSYNVNVTPNFAEICAPADVDIQLMATDNFDGDVTFDVANLPAGATATFSVNPVPPGGSSTLTISNTGGVASGSYVINISGSDGVNSAVTSYALTLFDAAPAASTLMMPTDGATEVSTAPSYNWMADVVGTIYDIQVAADSDFNTIVDEQMSVTNSTYNGVFLETETTYFWRVRGANLCGNGDWSPTFSFTTADILCGGITTTDQVLIPDTGTPTVTSEIMITAPGVISDINVNDLNILHSYIGDLEATLMSPAGTIVELFNRPGVPGSQFGCAEDNLLISFDDLATNTADDFENACGGGPAIDGSYQPIDLLSTFNGEEALGTWTLSVTDNFNADGGSIENWTLDLCTIIPVDLSLTPSEEEFSTCLNQDINFSITIGNDFEGNVQLAAVGAPMGTNVSFSQNPVTAGATVDVTISGNTTVMDYDLIIEGSDGTQINNTSVAVEIIEAPTVVDLTSPTNGMVDQALVTNLTWMTIAGVSEYTITIATDEGMTNVITTETIDGTSFDFNANYGTTYYWTVVATNVCGNVTSTVSNFTTVLDFTITGTPASITACVSEDVTYTIEWGAGFSDNITFTAGNLPDGATATFGAVTPGTNTTTVVIGNLADAAAGTYTLTLNAEDGGNSNTAVVVLVLNGPPPASTLNTPINNAQLIDDVNPTLDWAAVTGAATYRIEVATDDAFANIVESNIITTTNYTVGTSLDFATPYYWRVTAENDCGGTLSETFVFEVAPTGIEELNSIEVSINPNPTSGLVDISFSDALRGELRLDVFGVNGQLLQSERIVNPNTSIQLHLDNYPTGMYLVKMVNQDLVLTKRIMVQR